jgi:transposase
MPKNPPQTHRKWRNRFSPFLRRNRNISERMLHRAKKSRRIAKRYD